MTKTKKGAGLTPFEGKEVRKMGIAITNAGDGLSESMNVAPAEHESGERLFVILEVEVTKVAFEPLSKGDPGGPQKRIETMRAGTATLADAKLVGDLIAEQAERNLLAKERDGGTERLPGVDDGKLGNRVRTALSSLSKADLAGLCAKYDIESPSRATATDLLDLLVKNAEKVKGEIGE